MVRRKQAMNEKKMGDRYFVLLPKVLNDRMQEKMEIEGYPSVSELCRTLIRRWVNLGE